MKRQILSLLAVGEHTSSDMAFTIGVPEPSIRRTIQELRREGHNISFGPFYRLGQ